MAALRVLHLITSLDVGGAEMMLFKLLSLMDKKRFQNHVICLAGMGSVGQRIGALGIPVYAMDMPKGRVTVTGLKRLRRLMIRLKPDILQTWMYHADLLGLIFGKMNRLPRIFWNIRCSNMDLRRYRVTTWLTVRLCAFLSRLPDGIIANSGRARKVHQELGYAKNGWRIIPNGFDLMKFRTEPRARRVLLEKMGISDLTAPGNGADKTPPVIVGLIARHDPMKGHDVFIRAACRLLEKNHDIRFVLVGRNVTWENVEISGCIPSHYKECFFLLGEQKSIEILTAGLDIAVSASVFGEGFSNAVGEAMACGVPVAATDVGDSAAIVGAAGRVIPPGDAEALADALEDLIRMDETDRKALGKIGRQRVEDMFELSKVVKMYEELYAG